MVEKLLVEFEVEKEVKRDFGYVEKYLKYAGQPIPYKAIVREGKLLAIVSRKYLLVENEKILEICKKIAERNGLKLSYETFPVDLNTRIHVKLEKDNVGVVVHNSVDGSCSLRVDALVKIAKGVRAVFRIKDLKQVCRKHFGTIRIIVDDLEKIVNYVMEEAEEFKYFIDKLEKHLVKDHIEELEVLKELLPKRYVEKPLAASKINGTTLKWLYETVASKIWTSEIDMKTKVEYFNVLNNVMFAVTGWEN